MPSVASDDSKTKSGIITSDSGERHIPSSVRLDGTQRRQIKIRPGYRPPEDVEVYKNRTAEGWKTRGTGGIPGAEGKDEEKSGTLSSPSSNKNAKRREARKKAKADAEAEAAEEEEEGKDDQRKKDFRTDEKILKVPKASQVSLSMLQGGGKENAPSPTAAMSQKADTEVEAEAEARSTDGAEKEKLVRNLKKKLRQAKELKEKKDKGDGLLPEQFEKVIKINELIRQLDGLGFDGDGEAKEAGRR